MSNSKKTYSQRRAGRALGFHGALAATLAAKLAGADSAYGMSGLKAIGGRVLSMGLEDLDTDELESVDEAATDVIEDVKEVIEEHGGDPELMTEAQEDAIVETVLAVSSSESYFKARLNPSVNAPTGLGDHVAVSVIPAPGGFDYRDSTFSLESFDARSLGDHASSSIVFNFEAAKQCEFGEAFYPTQVLTTEQNGMDLHLRRPMIMNAVRHGTTGSVTKYNRRNIMDAFIDFTVLADDTTDIVPQYLVGNAVNNAFFAPGATPQDVIAQGAAIKTAPLAIGKKLDLKGISQNSAFTVGGNLDQNDSIDAAIKLTHLYFKIGASLVPVDIRALQYTTFLKAGQGAARRVECNFRSQDIILTGTTKDQDGVAAAGLTYLATAPRDTWVVRLDVSGTWSVDLETGETSSSMSQVDVDSAFSIDRVTGRHTPIVDPVEVAALKTALGDVKAVGYKLDARRSNLTRRQEGKITTIYEEVIRYVVPLGSPIVIQTPIPEVRTNVDLMGPISAVRARNSNNAVSQLLRFRDQLDSIRPLLNSSDRSIAAPAIEGIGHTVVYPTFETVDLNVAEKAQGTKSMERQGDVSSTIVNQIRDLAYRMHLNSGYEIAAAAMEGAPAKPILVIGTDPYILNHLQINGDTRLAGINFEYKIVSTMDMRIRNKIYLTLTQPSTGKPSPLLFGAMAWIPELITTVQMPRNGGIVTETMVQPRSLHVNFCPILGEINVAGITDAVTGRLTQNIAFEA